MRNFIKIVQHMHTRIST